MVRLRRRLAVRLTPAWLVATFLAVVIACVEACTATTGADNGPCGCDAAAVTIGPNVYTRCDVPVASVQFTGPCSGVQLPQAALVELDDAAFEEIVEMHPTADGECTVAITFANGSMYSTSFAISGQWEACHSDPHGCGEYLTIPIYQILIDACGDAGLFGSMPTGDGWAGDASGDAPPD
jgi:hypothetical protein